MKLLILTNYFVELDKVMQYIPNRRRLLEFECKCPHAHYLISLKEETAYYKILVTIKACQATR